MTLKTAFGRSRQEEEIMIALSSIMNTSLNALTAYQAAIAVTSENIANVDAAGYSKQTATIRENVASSGSEVSDVRRAYSQFREKQVIQAEQKLAGLETQQAYMSYVEAVFDESEGTGLSEALSDFWNSWEDVVDNPSGDAERSAVSVCAETLAERLGGAAEALQEIREEIDREIVAGVEQVNALTEQIAEVNQKIVQAEASGQDANALMDKLDALTEQLAGLVDFDYYQNDAGQRCIQLKDGTPLVTGNASHALGTERSSITGDIDIVRDDGGGNVSTVTEAVSGGSLGGCLAVRDEYIPGYLESLNDLAGVVIEQVNSLLLGGYDLDGDPGASLFTGSDATDIAVNQDILDDAALLAVSSNSNASSGNASVAQAIAALRSSALLSGGTADCAEFYSSLVSRVGADVESIESDHDLQSDLAEQCQSFRDALSSVSLDEESANLVLYQQAYEASAKAMTVLQEILETLVNL